MGNMVLRKLETWQEWLESDRLIATAFLHGWDEKKAEERFKAEASGEKVRTDTSWGLFDESGKMISTINTGPLRLTFEGRAIDSDELHTVGSLPENRGHGSIRQMMDTVLHYFKEKGDPFVFLTPFSFAFYRKFGFELSACEMPQNAKIDQFASFTCDYRVKQVVSQEDTDLVRALFEQNAYSRNLVELKDDAAWQYKGNGEFGERDWWFGDKQHYTYLFQDDAGTAVGYLTFVFNYGTNGPFIGSMQVIDVAYRSPEVFHSILGFIYGMRAKLTDVTFTLPRELDLSLLLPECNKVERKISGHRMGRVLNVERVLSLLRYPKEKGSFHICIEDAFLPENTGTYAVAYADGCAVDVAQTDGEADLSVTVETFLQMAIGLVNLDGALFRRGSRLYGNEETLRKVFVRKML